MRIDTMPTMLMTDSAQHTWSSMYQQKQTFFAEFKEHIHPSYFYGLSKLSLSPSSIPTIQDLKAALALAHWEVAWIPGYVAGKEYSRLIAQGIFPLSCLIRELKHLERSPIPDFLHDVWGHLPLLFDATYSKYLRRISKELAIAPTLPSDDVLHQAQVEVAELKRLHHADQEDRMKAATLKLCQAKESVDKHPSLSSKLGRLFAWTIEFGIFSSDNHNSVMVGAGLLSSLRECRVLTSGQVHRLAYTQAASAFDFQFTEAQLCLYEADGFDHWDHVLSDFLASERTS